MAEPFVRQRFDQARLINIANGLTATRVLLVPLFAYLLISYRFRPALLVFVVCGTSDMLDGILARWLQQRTVVGFYLDPIADKLLMATGFVVLAIVKVVPLWLAIMVISRDIFILIGSLLYLILLDSEDIAVTRMSKGNTAVQILTVIYFLASRAFPGVWGHVPAGSELWVTGTVVAICALSTAVSGIQYLLIGIRKLSRA
jgi:cardiolipin synthase